MPQGLRLTITNTAVNTTVERTFGQLPVRIGRNTLNDLPILDGFVSQFHAVVEVEDGALMLRDLGSSNGTRTGQNRAPAHQPIALAPFENVFSIGSLVFKGELVEAPPPMSRSAPPAPTTKRTVAPNLSPYEEQELEGILEDSVVTNTATLAFDDPAIADARRKLEAIMGAPASPAAAPPGKNAAAAQKALSSTLLLDPSQNARIAQARNAAMAAARDGAAQAKQRKLEQLALQGVREMARTLAPSLGPLEEPEDLVRFLSKVRDTVEVLLRTFLPLRAGYRQFATQMDLQRRAGAGYAEAHPTKSVETAETERDLAECLLDWKGEGGEAHRAVERTFADLMIHQLALLHAIMRGVKSLLHELSPQTVDAALGLLEKQGKSGFAWGPWRFKELWRLYLAKHGDMDDGDKRTFAHLFGRDFASAYQAYRSTVDAPPES